MGFNERVHAYIAAKYYVHLTETFGERGHQAFIHATQYYGMQRGRRMAQRAIREGEELTQTLHTSDCCIHRLTSGDIFEGSGRGKNLAGLRSFEYHCAHSYWAYDEVTAAIFQAEGEALNVQVLKDLADDYGKEMADIIWSYRDTNFNVS